MPSEGEEMRTFTIINEVLPGLRISPPFGDVGWHLRLGTNKRSRACPVPVGQVLGAYLDLLQRELLAACKEQPGETFRGIPIGVLEDTRREIEDGWRVDRLTVKEGVLYHSEEDVPSKCLVHLAVPAFLGAGVSLTSNQRDGTYYEDIDVCEGLTSLYTGIGLGNTHEHLFELEEGCAFRVYRKEGPWQEAVVRWRAGELQLSPERVKPVRARKELHAP